MGRLTEVLVAVLMASATVPVCVGADSTKVLLEMLTGSEEFLRVANFLEKYGGKYVYVDTRGHTHEFKVVRIDPVTQRITHDGTPFWIDVSCRRNVVERKLGRVGYTIDAKSIRAHSKDSSSADIAFFGYQEFLARRVLEE